MAEIKKRRGGPGRGQGRPPKPKAPEVADKQFAARVLALVGSERWIEMLAAVAAWRAYVPPPEMPMPDPDEAKKKKAPIAVPLPPPHPKTLVENDSDLALYYLVFNDDRALFVNLIEKRDGKAVHTVNHLHDKPIEMHHTFSISERIKRARERAAGAKNG